MRKLILAILIATFVPAIAQEARRPAATPDDVHTQRSRHSKRAGWHNGQHTELLTPADRALIVQALRAADGNPVTRVGGQEIPVYRGLAAFVGSAPLHESFIPEIEAALNKLGTPEAKTLIFKIEASLP